MPPLLSGNTLGLKFMQRGAAAKAAATEARRQEEAKKQAEAREEAVRKRDSSSSEADSDSSVEEDDGREDNEVRGPVASTSRLPARHQPYVAKSLAYFVATKPCSVITPIS